jgi:predicted permease
MDLTQYATELVSDLRYAARAFLRCRMFTLAAVATLAVGTGAGTAVFSVVDRILFRGLPYKDSARLVSFGMAAPVVPQEFLLAYDFLEWRDSQAPFESIAYWAGVGDCDLTETNAVRLRCASVDAALLPTLGVPPLIGRNFTPEENRPNAARAAMISYGFWQSRFGRNPRVAGQSMLLDGQPATIVGVLPRHFELPSLAPADVLVPLTLDEEKQRSRKIATLLSCVGRLRLGVSPEQAAAGLQPLFQRSLQFVSPELRKEVRLRVRLLRDRQVQEARLASWILLGSVLVVLFIACANVANLLLARSVSRQREIAVRAALGAARARLVRQALTESILLGVAGGAAGCALAFLLLRWFVALAPEGVPRLHEAALDLRVLLFTLTVSLLCGLLFGLAPAFRSTNAESIRSWQTVGGGHQTFRQALVAVQIAGSLVLLTCAGLLLRSLWSLQNQPLGMRTDHVVAAAVTLGPHAYPDPTRRLAFFEALEERIRRMPGVTDLAVSDSLPPASSLAGSVLYAAIDVQGRPRSADATGGRVASRTVTPGYFAVLRIPILRGRAFREEDRDPHQAVVVLSERLALRMFPGEDPLGKQIRPGRVGAWFTVIGVAGNVKNSGLVENDSPEFYRVRRHSADDLGRSGIAILRTGVDPQTAAGWLRSEIAALDPAVPVDIETIDQRIGKLTQRPRFSAVLLGIFAGVGILLAAIGLYGLMSFLVAQRAQEIGVRMALGATPGAISWMVLSRAARSALAGVAGGVVGSLFAARLLQAMLFQVSAFDALTLAPALTVLLAVALLAAWIPSRRAARLDPMQALRQE